MTALAPLPARPAPWGLVDRAQAGDREALAAIYQASKPRVLGFVLKRVGGNRTLAEDLTSETFTRALGRLDTVTYQGWQIHSWFLAIARNLVIDHYKAASTRRSTPAGDMLDADQVDEHTETQPETVALGHQLSALMASAIAQLTPDQQRVVRLRFYAEMSVAETAARLGINEGAVKALQYRACKALAKILGPAGGAW